MVFILRWLPLIVMGTQTRLAESHRHHNNNNRLMELLTAGIVAKVLQKQEGDGGGGHEYYPVPIHVPMMSSGSHKHHHHVTEKIIPIPVPHHTTRIIHINANSPHGGDEQDHGGGYGGGHGGYGSGHGGYDSSPEVSSNHHHSGSSPKIQQIVFQDSGLYGPIAHTQTTPVRHQAYMAYRRPAVGMMPAAAAHPAYLVRPRYPMVAVRQRVPPPYGVAAPMYAMPYRNMPAPAPAYMNSMMMMKRPYPPPMPMPMQMPAVW